MTTSSIHSSTIVPVELVSELIPVQQPVPTQGEKAEKQEKTGDVQQTQTQLAKDQQEMFNAGVTSGGGVATHQGKKIEGTKEKPDSKKQEPDNSKDTKTTEGSNSSSSSCSSSSSSMYSSSSSSFSSSSCQTSSTSQVSSPVVYPMGLVTEKQLEAVDAIWAQELQELEGINSTSRRSNLIGQFQLFCMSNKALNESINIVNGINTRPKNEIAVTLHYSKLVDGILAPVARQILPLIKVVYLNADDDEIMSRFQKAVVCDVYPRVPEVIKKINKASTNYIGNLVKDYLDTPKSSTVTESGSSSSSSSSSFKTDSKKN